MRKYLTRHVMLGLLAFVLALLSLLSLCFAVVRIDFASALNGVGGTDGLLESYGIAAVSESGFDLLGGNSDIPAIFQEFARAFAYSSGVLYTNTDYSWLAVFSQVCDIVLLVASLILCISVAGWFFLGKGERMAKITATAVWVLSLLYLAQGLIFSLILESDWQNLLDMAGGNASRFFGKLFDTLVYVPFILVVVFEVAFWMVNYKWKDAEAPSRKERSAAEEEKNDAPAGHDAQMQMFERLRMLKQLYDEGALTEQEYEEQKMKLLGSGE